MLQSSAYRTKRCPRRSSSRSSSSSTRLLSKGESGPPCGVPSTLGLTSPFSITPAFKNARMSFSVLLLRELLLHQLSTSRFGLSILTSIKPDDVRDEFNLFLCEISVCSVNLPKDVAGGGG